MQTVSFARALEALKAGKRVARLGWNGKGMFVYRVPEASYPAQTAIAKMVFGSVVPYRAYYAIRGADGVVATWVPSSTDLDADDWVIFEDSQAQQGDLGLTKVREVYERLRSERLDLGARIQKLQAFLPTPGFRNLHPAQRELMVAQNEVMCRYASILTNREALLEQELGGR